MPAGSLQLPWDKNRDYAVGEFARQQGSLVPTRLVDFRQVLAVPSGRRSQGGHLALEVARRRQAASRRSQASTLYLKHLAEAWNAPDGRRHAPIIGWSSRTSS